MQSLYEQKMTTLQGCLDLIASGDRICFAGGCNQPVKFMEQFENFSMPISRQQEYMMYGENYGQRDATSILAEGRYLRGKMDLQRMRESIFMVAQMHEALRMVCVKDGDSYILKLKSGKNNTPVFTTDEFLLSSL